MLHTMIDLLLSVIRLFAYNVLGSLLYETCEVAGEEDVGDKVTDHCGDDYAYQARHHETMVE